MRGSRRRGRRAAAWLALAAAAALARPALAQPPPAALAPPTTDREVLAAPAPLPTAGAASVAPPASSPASQALAAPLLTGKSLQPGEPGYRSLAWAAAWSFGGSLLPIIVGGFLTRDQSDAVMWTGLGLIAAGQSLGPSAGYWYAGERAQFTWYRLALSAVALAAAGYPLYGYTGRLESYNTGAAAALITLAAVAEAAAVALAAWDLSLLGEIIEKHNERPVHPLPKRLLRSRAAPPPLLAPLVLPNGGGLGVRGWF